MEVLSFIPAGANLRSCQHHDAIGPTCVTSLEIWKVLLT